MVDGLEVKLFLFHFFHVFHDTEFEYGIKIFEIFDKVEKFPNTPFVYPFFCIMTIQWRLGSGNA